MGKKAEKTKERIITVALKLFFEQGYEATSLRGIAKEVPCAVGLAYSYFKTKDDIFTEAINSFFKDYKEELDKLVNFTYRNPYQSLQNFFEFIRISVKNFNAKYVDTMHWTVKMALREKTLLLIEPCVEKILTILKEFNVKTSLDKRLTSVLLTHGIGSAILHDNYGITKFYSEDVQKAINLLISTGENDLPIIYPRTATMTHFDAIVEFIDSNFCLFYDEAIKPNNNELEYRIKNKECIILEYNKKVIGVTTYSTLNKQITLLLVDKKYIDQGLCKKLLVTAVSKFQVGTLLKINCRLSIKNEGYLDVITKYGFKLNDDHYELIVPEKSITMLSKQE